MLAQGGGGSLFMPDGAGESEQEGIGEENHMQLKECVKKRHLISRGGM